MSHTHLAHVFGTNKPLSSFFSFQAQRNTSRASCLSTEGCQSSAPPITYNFHQSAPGLDWRTERGHAPHTAVNPPRTRSVLIYHFPSSASPVEASNLG